jgi:hypothetical protein
VPKIVAEFLYKYKGWPEAALLPAIVVLVGLSAFGLGRLSVTAGEGPRLVIRLPDASTQTAAAYMAGQGAYVASKGGTKYYLPSCSGVSRIREENKVWFATVQEALSAGYTAAANCPGL